MVAGSTFPHLADSSVLIVGAPRSGTTWLAKILDSHPEVIYRHEPDDFVPPADGMRESMVRWIDDPDARRRNKQPFFSKAWQSEPLRLLRASLAYGAAVAGRLGLPPPPVPDFRRMGRARAVVKSVKLRAEIGAFAKECPNGKAILILRDPRGQIDSLIRGVADGRFVQAKQGATMAYDKDRALSYAQAHGVSEAAFEALHDAAKYAWAWREFNETAHAAVQGLPNAKVVVYRDLCRQPKPEAAALFRFIGLDWNNQTDAFVTASSTQKGADEYYSIMRESERAADRWRESLSDEALQAILSVVRDSPLVHYWPDLAA